MIIYWGHSDDDDVRVIMMMMSLDILRTMMDSVTSALSYLQLKCNPLNHFAGNKQTKN